jgi:hypothetical protein
MKIPLRQGRDFASGDTGTTEPVVIINQTLADILWPDSGAVGQRLRLHDRDPWATVVGVVGDVRQWELSDAVRPETYHPFSQNPVAWWKNLALVVRVGRHPAALARWCKKKSGNWTRTSP